MRVRSAALVLALTAGTFLAGAPLPPAPGVAFAQEPEPGAAPPPEPSPSPAPSPSPTPPPPIPPGPAPAPSPAPAPGRSGAAAARSDFGTAPIVQAYPMDYRSLADRLENDPNNAALLNELGDFLVQHGRIRS